MTYHKNMGRVKINFIISEVYFEAIRQDTSSKCINIKHMCFIYHLQVLNKSKIDFYGLLIEDGCTLSIVCSVRDD
jgi:hypothetical protein